MTTRRSSKRARHRKVKLETRRLPKEIERELPEGQLYSQLLNFEKKLDVLLRGKQLDINEALALRPSRKNDTLRLVVYNTYTNQNPAYHMSVAEQKLLTDPPSWTLRIEGYLVSEENVRYSSRAKRTCFSKFFQRILVVLDKEKFPDNNTVEWDSSHHVGRFDGFEVKRIGEGNTSVKVLLYLKHNPARYKLSPKLALLLDVHTDTKPRIITRLWQYIKVHKLQDPKDRHHVIADDNLQSIFKKDILEFAEIPKLVLSHLGPPDPIELEYTIQIKGSSYDYQKCYDISVEVEDTSSMKSSSQTKELNELDEKIAKNVKLIKEHNKKREFFQEMSSNPGKFLAKAVASQVHDYQVKETVNSTSSEDTRHAKFFHQPHSLQATKDYLANQATNSSWM